MKKNIKGILFFVGLFICPIILVLSGCDSQDNNTSKTVYEKTYEEIEKEEKVKAAYDLKSKVFLEKRQNGEIREQMAKEEADLAKQGKIIKRGERGYIIETIKDVSQ